jgi:hypothetical protein
MGDNYKHLGYLTLIKVTPCGAGIKGIKGNQYCKFILGKEKVHNII